MLTSGMDGLVHIWDVTLTENVQELPEILATISIPDNMKISFLAYSAEHDLLLTAGFGSDVVNRSWNLELGLFHTEESDPTDAHTCVSISHAVTHV